MALFGGKPKSIDTGILQDILNQGLDRQKTLYEGAYTQLPQVSTAFEGRQKQLGDLFAEGATGAAKAYAQNVGNIESPELVQQQQAKATELAFRNLPAAQQAIRENLAATGGLGRGAAIRALQQPVLQASQQAADLGFQLQNEANLRNVARREQALDNIYSTDQAVALQRLGIDKDTARTLLETGRTDILGRAFRLAGIEEQRTQGLLDIETLRQQQDIARDAAKKAQLGGILGTVGSIGGAGLGAVATGGSPIGALIGSQIGGAAGGLAGGSTQPMDLSGILTLMALRNRKGGVSPTLEKGPITPDASTLMGLGD